MQIPVLLNHSRNLTNLVKTDTIGRKMLPRIAQCKVNSQSNKKKNNIPLFTKNHKKETSKQEKKIAVPQSNFNLFSHLYLVLQSHEADMREFFSHEDLPRGAFAVHAPREYHMQFESQTPLRVFKEQLRRTCLRNLIITDHCFSRFICIAFVLIFFFDHCEF